MSTTTHEKFSAALEAFVCGVKQDGSILAAILCGSLSHDTAGDKCDLELVLVTRDHVRVSEPDLPLNADGTSVHIAVMPRAEFRRTVDGAARHGFPRSSLANGRLIYTCDDTIAGVFAQLQESAERDVRIQLLSAGASALPMVKKAHKWFRTPGDLEYAALWVLYAATPLARIETLQARTPADREVLLQATKLNPGFFKLIYIDLLNTRKSVANVEAALLAVDCYLASRTADLFGLVTDYLKECGAARSGNEIDDHFRRNFDVFGVQGVCEYLADQGLIGRAEMPVRLARAWHAESQELSFFHLADESAA